MVGQAPTYYRTNSGGANVLAGSGISNKSFHREGVFGLFYFGQHVDVQVVTQHGWDNAWFGQGYGDFINGAAANNNLPGTFLPTGSQAPSWNGVLIEPHYVYSPQLIFLARYETIRMSRQPDGAAYTGTGPSGITGPEASNFGNIDTYTVGMRYNPFMTSRAGFSWHNEFNWLHQVGTGPMVGSSNSNINTNELLTGFDFAF
jgi:hypothetical protein